MNDSILPPLSEQEQEQMRLAERILADRAHTRRVVTTAVVLLDELERGSVGWQVLATIIGEGDNR